MKLSMRPTAVALLLLLSLFLANSTVAQQKRQTPVRPQPKAAPAPAPTFDTIIPAESYNIYVEVRGVGQLISSSAATELLDPVLKLAGPPKEFKTFVKWLNAHADELMTSRLLVATWPSAKDVPEAVIAVEFASAEEAARFAKPLNEFLPKVLPPSTPAPPEESPQTEKSAGEKAKSAAPAVAPGPPQPSYYLQQTGSLILLTPTPLNLKRLKPAGSKLLSEDVNFRTARNRFNSEAVFVFLDMKTMERQEEEQRKKYEATRLEAEEKAKAEAEQLKKEADEPGEAEILEQERAMAEASELARLQGGPTSGMVIKEDSPPDPVSSVLTMVGTSFFSGESKWPEGLALALSIDNESFDIRALLLNQPGEKSDAVPFTPLLIPGPSLVPESPGVVPADSELLITMSLDLPQIYAVMTKPRPNVVFYSSENNVKTRNEVEHKSPFADLEKQLKMSIRDDVLPLFGSEIAVRLPVRDFDLFGLPRPPGQRQPESKNAPEAAPVLLISVKDREGARALMPKLIEAVGIKGASALAQTERREDTEIVSYAGFFSYAFVGNFLVLSANPATTRHVVNSYLKHETLSGDAQFRNSTRWQPRPSHGQVYISSALMESYRTWSEKTSTHVSDQTRAFFTRLTVDPQPITYSLSNEGFGPLHELHLPKNLVLMAVAGLSGETNPPPSLQNERAAMGILYYINHAEARYKEEKNHGTYGTLEQLIEEKLLAKEALELSGYKVEVTVSGDKFEATAVPLEYGKSGTMSYFMDETGILRGADRNGASATAADPPIQ